MKIGNPSADKVAQAQPAKPVAPTAEAGKGQAATPATPEASAKIDLSSAATGLLASSSSAEFDADKVARISQAINDGTFKINPDVIADKLISNAKELLTKSQH